jgi:hypothetical protein
MKSIEYYTATQLDGFMMVVACTGITMNKKSEVRCDSAYLVYTGTTGQYRINSFNSCLKYTYSNSDEESHRKNRTYRPSTYLERSWLLACKEANKYIPYEKFINFSNKPKTYEIY